MIGQIPEKLQMESTVAPPPPPAAKAEFEITADKPVRVICSRHPRNLKSMICLESTCYQLFCFDVELCSRCYEKYHISHRVVPLDIFLTTILSSQFNNSPIMPSLSCSSHITHEPLCLNQIDEITASFPSLSMDQQLRNRLLDRLQEFTRNATKSFEKIRSRCIKAQTKRNPKKQRLFPSRIGFHHALDRFFKTRRPTTITLSPLPITSTISPSETLLNNPTTTSTTNPTTTTTEMSDSTTILQIQIPPQYKVQPYFEQTFMNEINFAIHLSLLQSQNLLPPQETQDNSQKLMLCSASSNNSLLLSPPPLQQQQQQCSQSMEQHERQRLLRRSIHFPVRLMQSFLSTQRLTQIEDEDEEDFPFPVNAKPLRTIMKQRLSQTESATTRMQECNSNRGNQEYMEAIRKSQSNPRKAFDNFSGKTIALFNLQTESIFFGPIFPVKSDFIGIQIGQSIYYFSTTYQSLDLFYEASLLSNSEFLVCDLNPSEFCVISEYQLRIICKITGVALVIEQLEKKKITLLRRLNDNMVAYVIGYVIHLWDRRDGFGGSGGVVQKISLNLLAIQDIIESSKDRLVICANDHFFYVYDHLIEKRIVQRIDTRVNETEVRNVNCDNFIFVKAAKQDVVLFSYVGATTISVWNMRTYKKLRITALQTDQILAIVPVPTTKGTHFAVAGYCAIYIYDSASGFMTAKCSTIIPNEITQNPLSFYTRSLHVTNGVLVSVSSDIIRIFA